VVDARFRGDNTDPPATLYFGLITALTDVRAGTVTEVSGGAYARVAVTASNANFAGTQAAGSTSASSGTSGTTSNNGSITFPAPTGADWGAVVGWGIWTASSGGSLRYADTLRNADNVPVVRNIYDGDDAPVFEAGKLQLSIA
jgi:hypothetical protein